MLLPTTKFTGLLWQLNEIIVPYAIFSIPMTRDGHSPDSLPLPLRVLDLTSHIEPQVLIICLNRT